MWTNYQLINFLSQLQVVCQLHHLFTPSFSLSENSRNRSRSPNPENLQICTLQFRSSLRYRKDVSRSLSYFLSGNERGEKTLLEQPLSSWRKRKMVEGGIRVWRKLALSSQTGFSLLCALLSAGTPLTSVIYKIYLPLTFHPWFRCPWHWCNTIDRTGSLWMH